jgi:hypothetical protein
VIYTDAKRQVKTTKRLLVVSAVVMAACVFASQAAARDREVTRIWIVARAKELRAVATLRSARTAAAESLGTSVLHGCASALNGAPEGSQLSVMRSEVLNAVRAAANRPTADVVKSLIREVEPLRWQRRAVDRIAALFLGQQSASLAAPADVCSDVRYWIASGYRQLSPETVRFTTTWREVGVDYEGSLIPALDRNATASQRRMLRRVRRTAYAEVLHPPIGLVTSELIAALGISVVTPTHG